MRREASSARARCDRMSSGVGSYLEKRAAICMLCACFGACEPCCSPFLLFYFLFFIFFISFNFFCCSPFLLFYFLFFIFFISFNFFSIRTGSRGGTEPGPGPSSAARAGRAGLKMLHAVACLASIATTLQKQTIPSGPNAAVCNDGTPYVYYLAKGATSDKWVFFQQGGSYCWNEASCTARATHDSSQMSSRGLPQTLTIGAGILASSARDDPYFATWSKVQLTYCTSDAFSGTVEQSSWKRSLSFLGSRVVPSVIADLKANHGLVDGPDTTLIYSGASAGAVGLYPNLDVLSSTLLPASRVVGVIDSGWFLDSEPIQPQACTDNPLECSVADNLKMGMAAWSPAVDPDCAQAKAANDQWQCMMGHYVEPYLSTPIFVFQWQFDLAQLYHDGICFICAGQPDESHGHLPRGAAAPLFLLAVLLPACRVEYQAR
jgi:hypothetical protein